MSAFRRLVAAEARVHFLLSPCGLYAGQGSTMMDTSSVVEKDKKINTWIIFVLNTKLFRRIC